MNQTIKCKECGNDFDFTEAEQSYFKKLVQDGKIPEYATPKRCISCRRARKNQKKSY